MGKNVRPKGSPTVTTGTPGGRVKYDMTATGSGKMSPERARVKSGDNRLGVSGTLGDAHSKDYDFKAPNPNGSK